MTDHSGTKGFAMNLRVTHDLSCALNELRRAAKAARPQTTDSDLEIAHAAVAFTAQLAIEIGCTPTEIRALEAMLASKLHEPPHAQRIAFRSDRIPTSATSHTCACIDGCGACDSCGVLLCRHCGLPTPAEPYSEANPIVRICAVRVDSDGSHLPCVYGLGPTPVLGVRKPDESP